LHVTSFQQSSSNAPVERLHSSLTEIYRIILEKRKTEKLSCDHEDIFFETLTTYNNSIHSTTKYTPFESILLTKLNIIPKFILSEEEIKSINEFISNQNVTIESDEHLYRLLALETYINDSYIIIHVKIPIFNTQMYSLTHIVPLPLNKTKFLIVPNHIVYDRNNEILCLEEKCPKIHRTYICEDARTHTTLVNVNCSGQCTVSKVSFITKQQHAM